MEPEDTVPVTPVGPAQQTGDLDIEKLYQFTIIQLGPVFKKGDEVVLRNIVQMVHDETLFVGNRMSETPRDLDDFKSLIIQCSVIAYQNRGVEGQTRQGELGQENHFIDWHQYLQDEVVSHGKRYVI